MQLALNLRILSLVCGLLAFGSSHALTELEDSALSEVQGTGIAVALDDFRYANAPTSYIELTGTAGSSGWQRGDARYYGLSLTGGGTGTDWFGDGCDDSGGPLACPLGQGAVADFAPVYNPYVLRVFQYEGYDFQGELLSGEDRPTVLELVGPSQVPEPWRWSFWGEIEVDRDDGTTHYAGAPHDDGSNGGATFLQSQTIIHGKPVTEDGKPAILRLMQTENDADPTFGIMYESALSGDFRFSAAQLNNSPDALHWVPNFDDQEGLHFKNVDAYLPLGRLHSQAITLDNVTTGEGNFVIQMTAIPDEPNVYNDIYCGNQGTACNTQPETVDPFGNDVMAITSPNEETHGHVRWGYFPDDADFPGWPSYDGNGDGNNDCNDRSQGFACHPDIADAATNNGIYLRAPTDTNHPTPGRVTHLGSSRIEGMLVQSLTLRTLGAN